MTDATTEVKQLTMQELEAELAHIRRAPKEQGVLDLIVRRPQPGLRETLAEGVLDLQEGLVGDSWKSRGNSRTADGAALLDAQLTVMNSRVIALVAQHPERWPLAGDQLYIDMDLSAENLPPGTQIEIGSAVIEVTALPHTGCQQFVAHFGLDAMKFVNSPVGKALRLRGLNTKVVQPGVIRAGDVARKR